MNLPVRVIRSGHAEVRIFSDTTTLNRAAADEFIRAAGEGIARRDCFTVALSGGTTPRAVYSLLATDTLNGKNTINWSKIHIFFSDDRHVSPYDEQSNFRMAKEAMLAHVPIPGENVHRIRTELEAHQAADEYNAELESFFHPPPAQLPRFDLIMLGLGTDGHTASLFPGTPALEERIRLVNANWVDKFKAYRITFTLPLINAADEVMFLVAGKEKAVMLQRVMRGDTSAGKLPFQLIRAETGRLLWIVDTAAAELW